MIRAQQNYGEYIAEESSPDNASISLPPSSFPDAIPDSGYTSLSPSSIEDSISRCETGDVNAFISGTRIFVSKDGDGTILRLVEECGIKGHDGILPDVRPKQRICGGPPFTGSCENQVNAEEVTVLHRDVGQILQNEAEDWSSYRITKFCVPKLECSPGQTHFYSPNISRSSNRPIELMLSSETNQNMNNSRPFIRPGDLLSATVEIDCPIISKSALYSTLGMRSLQIEYLPMEKHDTTIPKTIVNQSMDIDALYSAENVNCSKSIGTGAITREDIPEGLETQVAGMKIKSPIENENINLQTTTVVAELRRVEENEMSTRNNDFQTMVSSESVSMDVGSNQELMQTDASRNGYISKKDIVIIHSDDDSESAVKFKDDIGKLCGNKVTPGVTVDLLDHIDAGKQSIGSLDSLHDRYRCILIYVTNAFQADHFKKFHSECVLVFGLDSGGDKLNRVVPVWVDVTRRTCKIPYLKTFNGITYKGSTSNYFEEFMFKTVKHFREMIK